MDARIKFYLLKNSEGKYFAFDSGYPYFTDITNKYLLSFKTLEQAQDFLKSRYCTEQFPNEFKDVNIVKFTLDEQEV